MKVFWFLALAVPLVFGAFEIAQPAEAGSCATAPTYAPAYAPVKAVKVVKEVVAVPTFVPVAVYPVAVPVYAASYVPPAAAPAGAAPAQAQAQAQTPSPAAQAREDAVLKALQAIDARLRALEGVPPPGKAPATPPAPPPSPPAIQPAPGARGAAPGPAVFSQKCAQCHTRGREKGDFVLVEPDGSLAKLDARQALAVARLCYSNRMPPRNSGIPALTDQEVGEVMAWTDTLK